MSMLRGRSMMWAVALAFGGALCGVCLGQAKAPAAKPKRPERPARPNSPTSAAFAAELEKRADALLAAKKPVEAEPLYARALRVREKLVGAHHPDLVRALYGLAKVREDAKHYEAAIGYHKRTLKILDQQLPRRAPVAAKYLQALETRYAAQVKRIYALDLERTLSLVVRLNKKLKDDVAKDSDTKAAAIEKALRTSILDSHMTAVLCKVHIEQKRPKAMVDLKRIAGVEFALGGLHDKLKLPAKAIPHYVRAMLIYEIVDGHTSFFTFFLRDRLKKAYLADQEFVSARLLHIRLVLRIKPAKPGAKPEPGPRPKPGPRPEPDEKPKKPDALSTFGLAEAEETLRTAVRLYEKKYGPRTSRLSGIYTMIADVYRASGKEKEAAEAAAKALKLRRPNRPEW